MEDQGIGRIASRVEMLRRRYAARDSRLADVQSVRRGDFEKVAPDLFTDEFPRPIVANLIDSSARHTSAALAPLPSFNCSSSSMISDSAKKFADKRTKIANNYVTHSKLKAQMQRAADQFFTYGLILACVEPDFESRMPRITYEDAIAAYPVWDRWGRTKEVARVFTRDYHELVAEYPEHKELIDKNLQAGGSITGKIEVVKYVSDKEICLYLPRCQNVTLEKMSNPLGRCYYVATQKPGLDDEIRGAFDDLIWVQIARHKFQMLALEAADKAVRAPLVVPPNTHEIPLGPDAIIRAEGGAQAVGRARIDVPPQTWASIQHLKEEMQAGSITPEALSGSIDASVITGKGVQQLAAGFSQQIAAAQDTLSEHFVEVLELCFRMDEMFWPDVKKSVKGKDAGVPYTIDYTPKKDIAEDYSVDVSYGFMAGLDANRALIFLLQAQGAGLLSDDYVRRNLPAGVNVSEESQKIKVEAMEQSSIQALSALAQSIPQLVANGMDPSAIVASIAKVTAELRQNKPIDKVMLEVFAPPPPPEPDPAAAAGDPMAAAMGGEASGFGPEGLPSQLGMDMAVEGPNARPDLMQMFAGISGSGAPVLQGGVSRMNPVV